MGATIGIVGAVLISLGHLAVGAGVMGVGALLDILDGVLARLTGRETLRGALLDSFTDRVGEIAVWSGLAYYLGTEGDATLVMLTIVGICGSLLIPYVRAKAEIFGVEGKGGWMGRAERLLVFGFGVGLSDSAIGWPTLEPTLWGLAALIWLTVFQRFYRTWKQLAA
jgi:CDP-diacylglycerol--glycerol-3-phosphate 3-phosphatidyltransferase